MNNIYEKYDNISTFDDFAFSSNKLIPQTLGVNNYIKYKNNHSYLKDFIKKNPERDVVNISNIYLFTFNRGKKSGGNFFHFHFHYMQRLIGFFFVKLSNKNIKLGIPINMLPFQKKIILSLVSESDIIYLDIYKFNYNIINCYLGKYLDVDKIPIILFNMYQNIGKDYINENINIKNENNVFIRRRCTYGGYNRYIINNDEVINFLDSYNFKYLYFEDYDMKNKILELINIKPKLVIIEIGSGLTNLLFFPKKILSKIKFIIIEQKNWKLEKSRIFDIIFKLNLNYKLLTCDNINNNIDNTQNNPFKIEIFNLNNLIK